MPQTNVVKKLLEGALTAAVLAFLLFNNRSPLVLFRARGRETVKVGPVTPEFRKQMARHAAFLAAQQDILPSLPAETPIGWCSETQTSLVTTPEANFIGLQAVYNDGRRNVSRHWIVRLEPRTNRVLGKTAWEE